MYSSPVLHKLRGRLGRPARPHRCVQHDVRLPGRLPAFRPPFRPSAKSACFFWPALSFTYNFRVSSAPQNTRLLLRPLLFTVGSVGVPCPAPAEAPTASNMNSTRVMRWWKKVPGSLSASQIAFQTPIETERSGDHEICSGAGFFSPLPVRITQ